MESDRPICLRNFYCRSKSSVTRINRCNQCVQVLIESQLISCSHSRLLQAEHDKEEKEEDLIERELLELSDPGLRLAANMRAADAEMHQLHDKVATLEVELHGERRRHQEVVAKLEDLQEQIHRYHTSHICLL
jgi:chromosome segregation ATPase